MLSVNLDSIMGDIIFYCMNCGDCLYYWMNWGDCFSFYLSVIPWGILSKEFFPSKFILIKLGLYDSCQIYQVIRIKLLVESSDKQGAMIFCLQEEFWVLKLTLEGAKLEGVVLCLTEVRSYTNFELINWSYEVDLDMFYSRNMPSPHELLFIIHRLSTCDPLVDLKYVSLISLDMLSIYCSYSPGT